MTQQEKAQELVAKFMPHSTGNSNRNEAIECALIAVYEILKVLYSLKFGNALSEEIEYWEEVKQELTKQQEQ
jgi:phage terminase small subunit